MQNKVGIWLGDELEKYGFGEDHPFGNMRMAAYQDELYKRGLHKHPNYELHSPVCATQEELALFHTPEYIELVKRAAEQGHGQLDERGDTPVYPEMFRAASCVVGSVLDAAHKILLGKVHRAFVPIAGLHHGMRDHASGFCVFNDISTLIEDLLQNYNMHNIVYVDIDAHHGDGIYYPFEDKKEVIFVDVHESGAHLFPNTGAATENGKGEGKRCKLNIPMNIDATDEDFFQVWPQAELFLERFHPDFIILVAGADSIQGDGLAHLNFTAKVHNYVTRRLIDIAENNCDGHLLVLGGGGYNMDNVALAWNNITEILLNTFAGRTNSLMA